MLAPITIPVEEETAVLYSDLTPEQRERVQFLLSLLVREVGKPAHSLNEIMNLASREAEAKGLTDSILEDLLRDES
jgi:diadenosine tetraphosphate (Ap4A) HIT family hydrolase